MSTGFLISFILLWALVVFSTLVLIGLVRAMHGGIGQGEPGRERTGKVTKPLGSGTPAPFIAATDLAGERFEIDDWSGQRSALLFVSPDCMSCKVTLPELEALHNKVEGKLVVVCRSPRGRCAQMAEEYKLRVPVLVDEDEVISKGFGIDIAPTAVLIAADGAIEASGHPMSADDLERMVAGHDLTETTDAFRVITSG